MFFEDFDCISENSKIVFFFNFCHSKSQFSWVQIDLKTSSVHPKPLQTLSGRLEDTSRYLQHPFGTLRSLSGEKRLITCFSNILTASQKIRKIGIFLNFRHSKSQFAWLQIDLKTSRMHPKPFLALQGR